VISDSLTWLLKQADVTVGVCNIDISGRTQFSTESLVDVVKDKLATQNSSVVSKNFHYTEKEIILPMVLR